RHRADLAVMPNGDWPQHRRANANGDVILDGRVALDAPVAAMLPPAGSAERDLMIQHHVVANLRRLADDDARAVVDEEAPPDARPRMNLDATGHQAGNLRDQPWDERHVACVERVGEAM